MTPHSSTLLSYLHRLAAPSAPDAVLLTRWIDQRDETAFSTLMARHGPMVLGICNRVLGDVQEAEDAFQATFLVLARQAAKVRRPEALTSFLYGITLRLARKASAAAKRRPKVQTTAAIPEPVDPQPHVLDALSGRELLALVDAEIARLPEVYRLPLLLCLLQGRTVEEAARQLGWTIGSLRGRLERGREQLRQRLTRRGIGLSMGVLALLTPAVVPEKLLAASLHQIAAPSSTVAVLLAGWTSALKLKTICLALVLVSAVGLGAGLSFFPAPVAETPTASAPKNQPAEAKKETRVDRYGDPLPDGAIARLGSLRFHVPDQIKTLAFSNKSKTLALSSHAGLYLIDAGTGQRIQCLPTLGRNWTPESHLAFSPDDKRLLSFGPKVGNGGRGVVHVWDLTGPSLPSEYQLKEAGSIVGLGWSDKGDPLAIRDERGKVFLHELATGKSRPFACKEPAKTESGDSRNSLFAYAPGGHTLALVDNSNAIHVWDSITGRKRGILKLENAEVRRLTLSPDGRMLATVNLSLPLAERLSVQLLDVTTGKLLHTLETERKNGAIPQVTFSPDGKTLAEAGRHGVRFWDVATVREKVRSEEYVVDAECIAFSGDGRTLAAAQRISGAFHLWDVATGKRKTEPVGHSDTPYGAAFSPDGRRVVSCRSLDGTYYVWDAASGESLVCVHRHPQWVRDVLFSADGRTLFSTWTDDELWISDATSGKKQQIIKLKDPDNPNAKQIAWAMNLSDDGKILLVLSHFNANNGSRYQDTLITGWEASTRKQLFWRRQPGDDTRLALSSDNRLLAMPYPPMDVKAIREAEIRDRPLEQTLRVEDAMTGKPLLTLPMRINPPSPLAFSPDGRWLVTNQWRRKLGETKSCVQLWETATATVAFALSGSLPSKVAFSPNGRLLALTAPAREILIWDLTLDREHRRFKGFDAEVTHLAFSPHGRRLVSGLDDATLLIWDVGTPISVRKLDGKTATKAWNDLASRDAALAFRARGMLISSPEIALPLLTKHLHPAKSADPQRLRRLLADLDSDQFAMRQEAQEELEKLGDLAEPALRRTLADKPTLEVRKRVQAVLECLRGPVTRPEMLQALRAVAVLEDIGTPEARRLLRELAEGAPEARPAREAKAALQRLGKQRK